MHMAKYVLESRNRDIKGRRPRPQFLPHPINLLIIFYVFILLYTSSQIFFFFSFGLNLIPLYSTCIDIPFGIGGFFSPPTQIEVIFDIGFFLFSSGIGRHFSSAHRSSSIHRTARQFRIKTYAVSNPSSLSYPCISYSSIYLMI